MNNKAIAHELRRAADDIYRAYNRLNKLTAEMTKLGLEVGDIDHEMKELDQRGININELATLAEPKEGK